MIILDTCVLIFDALIPEKLSSAAKKVLAHEEKKNQLFCCDISLWEIAMLVQKKRLNTGSDAQTFLQLVFQARQIQPLSINLEIAALSADSRYKHLYPADRLIAATAIHYRAELVTCDKKLHDIPEISIIW